MKKVLNWLIGFVSLIGVAFIYGLFTSKNNKDMKKTLDKIKTRKEKIAEQEDVDERVLYELGLLKNEQEELRKKNDEKIDKAGEDIEQEKYTDPDNAINDINDDLTDYTSESKLYRED